MNCGRWVSGGVALGVALVLWPAGFALAANLTQVSSDPYLNATSQHKTEVEPDTFAFGSTVVGAFQVGRFNNGGASNIGWTASSDSGASWSAGFLSGITKLAGAGSYDRVSDPSVAYDAKHGAWLIASLALVDGPAPRGVAVLVNRSTDGGQTWDAPVTVAAAGSSASLDKDWIACDNTSTSRFYGHCYAQWDDAADGDRIKMSTSTTGGLSWGPPLNTAGNDTGLGGQPLVQPDGRVIVPMADASERSLRAFQSTDGGGSWTATVAISPATTHRVAGSLRSGPLPSAEMDGAGKVYVVWQDCRFRLGCQSNDIVMSTSSDGSAWSPVVRVPIDPPDSTSDHFIPGLSVGTGTSGSSAKLGLAYYYYPDRSCDSASCQLDVGYISSGDGGGMWSSAEQLAGPMALTWLASTTQGYMVGGYISSSFVGDVAHPLFAVAKPPGAGLLDEAMHTGTGLGSPIPGPTPPPTQTSPPPSSAGPPASGAQAQVPPVMRGLRLTPRVFRAARSGASIATAIGAVVRYRVSAVATTTFRVQRRLAGHRRNGQCVGGRARGRARGCTRYVVVPGLFLHRDRAGLNRFHFSGRLAGKSLRAGNYRLLATSHDDIGFAGRAAAANFAIVTRSTVNARR